LEGQKAQEAVIDKDARDRTGDCGNSMTSYFVKIRNFPGKWNFILISVIGLFSFSLYFNTLFNDFVYDDLHQIVENPWITDVKYVPDILSKDFWSFAQEEGGWHYYRPAMHLVNMTTYHLFGLRAWGFHLVNILFHVGVSILVFLITSNLFSKRHPAVPFSPHLPSLAAALLFAAHPIHTEVVAWAAGIADLTATCFGLLSFFFYAKSEAKELWKASYLFSLAFFSLALFSKETALIVPLLPVIYDFVLHRISVERFKFYLPYFLLCLVYLLVRFYVLGGFAPFKRHGELSPYQYAINIFPLFVQYLWKLLYPVNLSISYVFHPLVSIREATGMASLGAAAAFVILGLVLVKRERMAFCGLCLVALPLVPALYIPGLGENTFAERYLYFPSVGFVLLIALGAAYLARSKKTLAMIIFFLGALLVLYGYGTAQRNRVWRSEYTLWSDTVRKSPDSETPHNNLGVVYIETGEIDKAIGHLQTALRLKPDYAGARHNLGVAYNKKGMVDKAIEQFRIALDLKPRSATYLNLGMAYSSKGMLEEAIAQFRTAIKLKSEDADAHLNLGIAYGEKGWMDKAIEHLQEAVRLNPADPYAHHNLANAYRIRGIFDKAEEHRLRAKELRANTTTPSAMGRQR
jgi:Flp pilus assembly protein TadD